MIGTYTRLCYTAVCVDILALKKNLPRDRRIRNGDQDGNDSDVKRAGACREGQMLESTLCLTEPALDWKVLGGTGEYPRRVAPRGLPSLLDPVQS